MNKKENLSISDQLKIIVELVQQLDNQLNMLRETMHTLISKEVAKVSELKSNQYAHETFKKKEQLDFKLVLLDILASGGPLIFEDLFQQTLLANTSIYPPQVLDERLYLKRILKIALNENSIICFGNNVKNTKYFINEQNKPTY